MLPGLTGTTQDALIADLIVRVGDELARLCFWPESDDTGGVASMESATYILYPEPDGVRLDLGSYPISSVTSILEDSAGDWTYATTVSSSAYALTSPGIIELVPGGSHSWATGRRAVKVTAVIGYGTVPGTLEQAAIATVVANVDASKPKGRQADQVNRGTVGAMYIPLDVQLSIQQFQRFAGLAQ